jgi:hypothetical protein
MLFFLECSLFFVILTLLIHGVIGRKVQIQRLALPLASFTVHIYLEVLLSLSELTLFSLYNDLPFPFLLLFHLKSTSAFC